MSARDQWDEQAGELLPCQRPDDPCQDDEPDARKCPECYRRPTVAAKLREMGVLIEVLRRNCEIERETFEKDQDELAALRAENETLHQQLKAEAERVTERDAKLCRDRFLGYGFPGGGISELDNLDGDTQRMCATAIYDAQRKESEQGK